jgi:hypothetical protein
MEILNLRSSWQLRLDLSAERLEEILTSAAEPVVEISEIEWLSGTSPQIEEICWGAAIATGEENDWKGHQGHNLGHNLGESSGLPNDHFLLIAARISWTFNYMYRKASISYLLTNPKGFVLDSR